MEKYNLFLDDIREPSWIYEEPPVTPWKVVTSYEEFVDCITTNGLPYFISFDHDLGEEKTGYDAAKYLGELCMSKGKPLPEYAVHSANPVGAKNIREYLKNVKVYMYGK